MSEWRECRIKDIALNMADAPFGSNLKTEDYTQGGAVVLQGKNIQGRKCIWSNVRFVSTEKYLTLSKHYAKLGCLVFPKVGTIGKVGILTPFDERTEYLLSTNTMMLEINPEIALQDFIYYFFSSTEVSNHIKAISSNSVQPVFNFTSLRNYIVNLPPLPEQKAIAYVLSSLDDKIDLLHRQNKTLEAMAETLFRQWFVEEAQDDWEEKELKDILEFVVDNRGKTAPTSEIGIPLIATNCIKNNNIFPTYEKIRYISEETYNNWFRSHPEPGDLIFVNKGTPGCVNLAPNPVDFCIAQDMIALRANKNYVSNYYLFLFLRSEDVQNQIINSSVGTTIPHLKKTDLLSFKIIIPDNYKLNGFNKMVESFFLKMNSNSKQIRTLETLRDTLLPKLMSGEVRVDYP